MSGTHAESDRHSQAADDSFDDFLQSVTVIRGLNAVEHFTEDNTSYFVELSRQLQLHQHAVDLKGLGGDIFEKQDCACGLKFVGRAERCRQDREASAVQ